MRLDIRCTECNMHLATQCVFGVDQTVTVPVCPSCVGRVKRLESSLRDVLQFVDETIESLRDMRCVSDFDETTIDLARRELGID